MDNFLDKYVPLVNKNTPIIISYGECISNNIFNKKCLKSTIDKLVQNIHRIENTKYKISHSANVTYYKSQNYIYTAHNHTLEFMFYTIRDRCSFDNMLIQYIDTIKDQSIVPSIDSFDSTETVNIMNILLYNSIDIQITDFSTYYTADIILKKPLQLHTLLNVINTVFNI
jgi:hypothetical protein